MTTFPDLLTSFATTWASAEKTRAQSDFFKSVDAATASARADFVTLLAATFIDFIGAIEGGEVQLCGGVLG